MVQNYKEIRKLFTAENLRFGISLLLAFFVLSSKHIIIYNEETLVLLCFIGFLFFSSYMISDSIENSLNERSLAIYSELQNSLHLKESLLIDLINEHKKQILLKTILNSSGSLSKFSISELSLISSQRQKALHALFSQHVQQKLKALLDSQVNLQEKMQKTIVNGFRGNVLEVFQLSKKTLQPKLVQQALQQLRAHVS